MRFSLLGIGLLVSTPLLISAPLGAAAQTRVPGDQWMRFVDPAEAGFDATRLEAAHETWKALPSSAFIVVADGAVVAAWGDLERRFMCHSVRKSFLSALYGIYWDRGELELNKTLADLGLDDDPDPLLDVEKRARILDLLKARSGVFHPAAYAGRTDSRPRGSEGPGRYFAYNNWDFNTLATILMKEVGVDVFEAFGEHFGQPLGMDDWRVTDGYYHYEPDKSLYPAYPFRMSARDAARFGLLFARSGMWGDERILSRHWVKRSTALYSIDNDVMGYGFMWWVFREPRFEPHGMVSALGVGNQMIAALPDSDIVIVNRANTYDGEGTPMGPLLDLIEDILEARTGEVAQDPELTPLERSMPERVASAEQTNLSHMAGTWPDPPAPFGLPAAETVEVTVEETGGEQHLRWSVPGWGTFELYPQADGTFLEEDSGETRYPVHDQDGTFTGITDARTIMSGAIALAAAGKSELAENVLGRLPEREKPSVDLVRAVMKALEGEFEQAADAARALAGNRDANDVEGQINAAGYDFLRADRSETALIFFELNTLVFPESSNVWDSLAEVHMELGNTEEAIEFYSTSLDLNPRNDNARAMMSRLQEAGATR